MTGMEETFGTVKFTMQDGSQTLTVSTTKEQSTQTGQTLFFTYSNATAGTNQYVSCVLIDSSGDVKYYVKLADSSSAASGELSVPLTDVTDGTYTLQIFSEEAKGTLYTDFCSESVTMTVTVSGGSGTADGCTVTKNSQKDRYAAHIFTSHVSNNNATRTEDGTETAKCEYCEDIDTGTDMDNSATGHDWGEPEGFGQTIIPL